MAPLPPPQTTGPSPFTPMETGYTGPRVHQPFVNPPYVNPPPFPPPPIKPGEGPEDEGGTPGNNDDGTGPGNWNPPVPANPGDGHGGWGPGGDGGHHPPPADPNPPFTPCAADEYWSFTANACVPFPITNPVDPWPDEPGPAPSPVSPDTTPDSITPTAPETAQSCDLGVRCSGVVIDPADFEFMKDVSALCDDPLVDGNCAYGLTALYDNPAGTIICTGVSCCASNGCCTYVLSLNCCYDGWGMELANASAWHNYDFGATVDSCADWCNVHGDTLPPCFGIG